MEHIGVCGCRNEKLNCELLPDLVIVPFFTKDRVKVKRKTGIEKSSQKGGS